MNPPGLPPVSSAVYPIPSPRGLVDIKYFRKTGLDVSTNCELDNDSIDSINQLEYIVGLWNGFKKE